MEKRNTKEVIAREALQLFSEKGYDGVSMRDIAQAVGIRAPSIYKHYSGKEAILSAIVQVFEEKTEQILKESGIGGIPGGELTMAMITKNIQRTFTLYIQEPFFSKCRKLLMMEALGNPKLGKLYVQRFIEQPIRDQTGLFRTLAGKVPSAGKSHDPEVMSYHFFALILLLLQEYDYGAITTEEALRKIELLTTDFSALYKV